LAKIEAQTIRVRTIAGLERARAKDEVLARPPVKPEVVAAGRAQGVGILKTARLCG
jgi:hypothetical protein